RTEWILRVAPVVPEVIRHCRSTGTRIANTIAVLVGLVWVRDRGAVITRITDAIAVCVSLVGIRNAGAIIAGVGDPVPVPVGLVRVGARAVVAGVAYAVTIRISLIGVWDGRAVVDDVRDAITVRIHHHADGRCGGVLPGAIVDGQGDVTSRSTGRG